MKNDPSPFRRPPPIKATAGAVLVDTRGYLLLQQRDDIPGIDNPGMIGLFGGHLEGGEDFRDCVVREIEEETGHRAPPDAFTLLTDMRVTDPDRGEMAVAQFLLQGIPREELHVTEGRLFCLQSGEIERHWRRLTPFTGLALRLALRHIVE